MATRAGHSPLVKLRLLLWLDLPIKAPRIVVHPSDPHEQVWSGCQGSKGLDDFYKVVRSEVPGILVRVFVCVCVCFGGMVFTRARTLTSSRQTHITALGDQVISPAVLVVVFGGK